MKVGFVGWRGMVGSVLMQRMSSQGDFKYLSNAVFFSTSNIGGQAPDFGQIEKKLFDAYNLDILKQQDIIVTCQGSSYTNYVYHKLRECGWLGFWIDASSSLRMKKDSVIVLDPINRNFIDKAIKDGIKDYIGGNCTVSLLLLALGGLFKNNLIQWVSTMTYQAASGAGAKNMLELIKGMGLIHDSVKDKLTDSNCSILDIDHIISNILREDIFPKQYFGTPLAGSLIPWIDEDLNNGKSKEEYKSSAEANKILNTTKYIPIDGLCVRIGAMRCHSQALTIKLNENLSLSKINEIISDGNKWVELIPNNKQDSMKYLSPVYVNGTLKIPIGRIRYLDIGEGYISAFTVGDQLLWGAAEPIRRILLIILGLNPDN